MAAIQGWQQLALYAVCGAIVLTLLFRVPYVGKVLRSLISLALFSFSLFLLLQHAPYDPTLARLTAQLDLDRQEVVGREVRIRMSPDGHFWADVSLNGVRSRMLIDSGATITALSTRTAQRASVRSETSFVPVIMRTANGTVRAQTGRLDQLAIGAIEARDLPVIVAPALGNTDVLGMNFLSQLASWRVEGRILILVPSQSRAALEQRPASASLW